MIRIFPWVRVARGIASATLLFAAAACGSDTTEVVVTAATLQRDTLSGVPSGMAGELISRPLVVQALDSRGDPLEGVEVQWVVVSGGGSVDPATSTTNSEGRAETMWRLGSSGAQEVEARVSPLAPVKFVGILSTCTPTTAQSLAVGEAREVNGTAAAELCLRAGTHEEFVVVAHHQTLDSLPTLALGMSVAGVTTFLGPPRPNLLSDSWGVREVRIDAPDLRPDERFHRRLRGFERTALTPLRSTGGIDVPESPSTFTATAVPAEGDTLTINANANRACDQPVNVKARVAAVTQHAIVLHDVENPGNGFTDADYRRFGVTFDTLIHPVALQNFGAPTDIDGNAHSFLLYTRKVNELTPRNSGSYIGGFFFSRDLFPREGSETLQACPASNEMEIFYLLVPDPEGVINDNVRPLDFVARVTLGTISHEYQHLINAGRRLHVTRAPFEAVWLDEGLAHMAEELVFYRSAGLSPRSNLTLDDILATPAAEVATNTFLSSNLFRFRDHMTSPEANSPHRPEDDLARRGAAWYFLRYLADRRGGDESVTWNAFVNSSDRGWANVQGVIGVNPAPWLKDWAVALHVDDAVPGVPAQFLSPSWNMRSVYSAQVLGGRLPLATHVFAQNAPSVEKTLVAGGTLYGRFAVPASGTATVHTLADGRLPTSSLRLTLIRTQ